MLSLTRNPRQYLSVPWIDKGRSVLPRYDFRNKPGGTYKDSPEVEIGHLPDLAIHKRLRMVYGYITFFFFPPRGKCCQASRLNQTIKERIKQSLALKVASSLSSLDLTCHWTNQSLIQRRANDSSSSQYHICICHLATLIVCIIKYYLFEEGIFCISIRHPTSTLYEHK